MMKSSDLLQTGADRAAGLRWIYADVTDSARDLARSHLCGPASELALAEALAAVALLGADLEQPEETVTLQRMQPDGSIIVITMKGEEVISETKIRSPQSINEPLMAEGPLANQPNG